MKWEDFSKEDRLLLCCARKEMSDDWLKEMRNILAQGLEWDYIFKSGAKHGILSLIYNHLKGMNEAEIPIWLIKRLKDIFYRTTYRNMRIYSLLKQLLKEFKKNNIGVILLKGVALAEKVYDDIGLRFMVDIDLLIKKVDIERVENLMIKLDCLPRHETDEGNKSYNYFYNDSEGTIPIEVHWDIENTPCPFPININDFWGRAQWQEINDTHALVFSPEDLILLLCLHTTYHHGYSRFIPLSQICDISEAIKYYRKEIDWSKIEYFAQQYGLSNVIYCTLYIVENLLNSGIPLDKIEELKSESFKEEYANFIIKESIFTNDPFLESRFPTGIVTSFSSLSIVDRVKDMVKAVFIPPVEIAKRNSVSPYSYKIYLYYFLRIYQLLVNYSGMVIRLLTRNPIMTSQLEKEIWVSKRQSEIDRWLEPVD